VVRHVEAGTAQPAGPPGLSQSGGAVPPAGWPALARSGDAVDYLVGWRAPLAGAASGVRRLLAAVHVGRPARARTGVMRRSRRCRQAAPADRAAGPAAGESSDWTIGYPPVVRRARVGLLPSRSGRVTMYAAASTGRPRSSVAPAYPSVVRCQGARKLGRLPAPPRRLPSHPRPDPGQPCSQQMIVAAPGTEKGAEGAMRSRFVRRSSGGVPGPWQCVRRACPADGLTAPSTRVPAAERPSLCR